MRTRSLLLASALVLASAAGTLALNGIQSTQAAGDPAAGRQLTRDICADCHRTPAGVGGGDGPSLDRLSRERRFTPDGLAEVMTTDPHDSELRLTRSELRHISGYLNVAGTKGAQADRQLSGADASDDTVAEQTSQQAMPLEDVIRQLSQQGYSDIREIEREDGDSYEVYARAPDGEQVEIKVDAITGKVRHREEDD
ncbi:MAG: PepSY domain-containing protein [Rhodovibrio sp.]|nr:PepSY domain-containing protein [Rhodovibrio sp.]